MKFEHPLHVGAPNVGDRALFQEYLDGIFERRWFTNRGMLVKELECRLAEYLGVRHVITMCNGTVALEIAIRALGFRGEVILPPVTFVATAHALQWQEITPVFCDVDRNSYCIDPEAIERLVTPRTSGIIGVHVYGRPCAVEALQGVADRHGLGLMFDAAHAFGCSYGGRMIGSFGRCEVLSFHATKFFNTFEGGAVATNDDELAHKIRLMQNFGFRDLDDVIYIGTNGKMTEVCAAMGLANLLSIEDFITINRRNYEAYADGIAAIRGLRLMPYDTTQKNNWQYVVVEVGDDYPLSRDALVARLAAENVLARKYFWPGCHRMEPYRSLQPNAGLLLPVAEEVTSRILLLPTGTAMNPERIGQVLELMQ